MKKIVHLTSVHPVQDVRIYYKECLSLKKTGYQVTIIAQSDQDSNLDGIAIVAIKKTISRFKRMTLLLWKMYRKAIKENADLYHFHDPELIVVGLLLRLHGKKVIYDIHEDVPRDILLKTWIKPILFRRIIAKLFERVEQFSANFFNGVITVTPLINQRFALQNAIEVRNYPNVEEFDHSEKDRIPSHLCYAGLIGKQRGILEMLQVAEETESTLTLAGQFNCDVIKNKVINSGFINYLGYLSREKLQELYSKSYVGLALLHPVATFKDSLPIKIFEYMAAGLPVIASDFSLWRDIIETHGCGFCVDPFNIKLIARKITYLRENPNEAREMGIRGRKAIEKNYNWQHEFAKLQTVYQRVLR